MKKMQRVQYNYGAILSRAISIPFFYKLSVCFQIQNSKNLSTETDVVKRIGPLNEPCAVSVCALCVCELDSSMRVSHQTHMASSSTGVLTSLPDVRRSE